MKLTVRGLRKSFGDLQVLNGIDLEMESGRVYCLMGPSGSGKTTLLRILRKTGSARRSRRLKM